VLLTLLALAVPAFALGQGDQGSLAPPGPAALSVSTTVESCGLAGSDVVCRLNVSYDSVSGASTYTATVTRADGSVVDYGSVGAGGTSLYVPYVGPGTYSVRITAYGTPPSDGGHGNVIATGTDKPAEAEVSHARGNNSIGEPRPGRPISRHAAATQASSTDNPGNAGVEGGAATAAAEPAPNAQPPAGQPSPPPCEPVPPELNPLPPDHDPTNDDEDADAVSDADELAAFDAGTQLTVPDTGVECPATP